MGDGCGFVDFLFELGELVGVGFHSAEEVCAVDFEVVEAALDGSHLPFVLALGDPLFDFNNRLLSGGKASFPIEVGEVSLEVGDAAFEVAKFHLRVE